MSSSHIRAIAIATLLVFLAGIATLDFSTRRISHELVHAGHGMLDTAHYHDAMHDHDAVDAAPDARLDLGDTEHNLLHAVASLQPALLAAFAWQPPIQDSASPAQMIPPKVVPATREPPFRPPRHLLS